jgi:hypothetical protein
LVVARLEQVKFSDEVRRQYLPHGFSQEQMPNLASNAPNASPLEARIGLLIDDVKRKITQVLARRRTKRRSPIGPYLINRQFQEKAVGAAMERLARKPGVAAFFVAAPRNEGPDEFIDRLKRHTSIARLNASWEALEVAWPTGEAGAQFEESYLHALRMKLPPERRIGEVDEQRIASVLGDFDRPVAAISRLHATQWLQGEAGRIKAWLRLWQRLGDLAPLRAIPILSLVMSEAKPGWKHHFADFKRGARECPPGGEPNAPTNRSIWNAALRVKATEEGRGPFAAKAPSPGAAFEALPILHPVTVADVGPWLIGIEPDTTDNWAVEVKRNAYDLFKGSSAHRHGVNLQDFAEAVRIHFAD